MGFSLVFSSLISANYEILLYFMQEIQFLLEVFFFSEKGHYER